MQAQNIRALGLILDKLSAQPLISSTDVRISGTRDHSRVPEETTAKCWPQGRGGGVGRGRGEGVDLGAAVAVGVAVAVAVGVGEGTPQGLTGQLKNSVVAIMVAPSLA